MSVVTRARTLAAAGTVFALAFLGAGSAVAAPALGADTLPPLTRQAQQAPPPGHAAPADTKVDPLCELKRLHFVFKDPRGRGNEPDSEQYLPSDDGKLPRAGMHPVMPGSPQHSAESFRFLGWYYANEKGEAGDVKFDPATAAARSYNVTKDDTTEVPVVAKYAETDVVTFHNVQQGQDIIEGVLRVPDGMPVEDAQADRHAPYARAAASGSYLDGWSKNPSGKPPWDLKTEPVYGNTDLYAHFVNGRTVTFDTAGGSFVPVHVIGKKQQFDPDDAQHADKPTRQGYKFLYWSLDPAGKTRQRQFRASDTPMDGNGFTLHAVWQPVEVPYALVYMREVVPDHIPGPDYQPKYVVDSVATAQALTDSDAPAVQKTITEASEIRNGRQQYITFVYDKERTEKQPVKVKGDGSSVKYVYYNRPRHDLTYSTRLKVLAYDESASGHSNSKVFTKTYRDVIAGFSEKPYQEMYQKAYVEAVKADAEALEHWRNKVPRGDKFLVLFTEDPDSYHYFTFPPDMPDRDLNLEGRYIGPYQHAYNYVEIDPAHPGLQPGQKYPGGTWNPENPLPNGGRVLNRYSDGTWQPVKEGEVWPGRLLLNGIPALTPTDEDFIPVRGFKVVDNADSYNPAYGAPSTSSYTQSTPDGQTIHNFFIRYQRLKYSLDLRANGGPGGDTAKQVLYDDPLGDKLPYTIDQTTRERDGAVFKGWYRDPTFAGEPIDAVHENMPYHGLVLYAKWQVPQVVVNYHSWDSKNPQGAAVFHTESDAKNSVLSTLHAPEKVEGTPESEFQGWVRYNRQGYRVPVRPGMKLVKDKYDLYPAWPLEKVEVQYHHQGDGGRGSGDVPDTKGVFYRPNRTGLVMDAPKLVPPSGKVFLGWRVRGDQNKRVYQPGDIFPIAPVADDGAVHLEPVWGPQAPSSRIVYHANGGQGPDRTVDYPAWAREDFDSHPRPSYKRPDYEFRGWGRQAEASSHPMECEGALYLPPGTSHLYALWNVSAVTITIKKVDADGRPLKGAEFKLYRERNLINPVGIEVQPSGDGTFSAASLPTSTDDSDSRQYWLAETKAPPGHELMPIPVGFTLRKVPTVHMDLLEPDAVPNVKLDGTTMTIQNVPAGHLPAAGGPGHLPYYLAAAVLLAGATLIARRRRQRA